MDSQRKSNETAVTKNDEVEALKRALDATTDRDGETHRAPLDFEAALLARAARGDQNAFATLHRLHARAVLLAAYGVLRNRADAGEAAQEAWLDAWKGAAGFDARKSAVRPWLVMLVRSRALNLAKRRGTAAAAETAVRDELFDGWSARQAAYGERPDAALERKETRERVHAELRRLPLDEARAIHLQFWEGRSEREIAAAMGVTRWQARGFLQSALARLWLRLDDEDGG